ncbi:MAG: response regulator [Polyangiaceae bacterium]
MDDHEDSRVLYDYALTNQGAEVRLAASARDAREILAEWAATVIVADLSMPDEDGFSLIESIRANPATSAIPAVALSGAADDASRAQALATGFQTHLSKPVDIGGLVLAIVGLGPSRNA